MGKKQELACFPLEQDYRFFDSCF